MLPILFIILGLTSLSGPAQSPPGIGSIFSSGFETESPPSTTIDSRADAARFLMQSTFGPTDTAIDELVALGDPEAWIDQQMALPISRTLPYVQANSNGSHRSYRHYIWWRNAMENEDQLRQRVAFALSEIFVISDLDYFLGNTQYGVSHYYDMLAENAFGNYRELLENVTLHPTMGMYLSMVRNRQAVPELNIRPDENYAREVLQLFSIGLHELNQRGEALPTGNPVPTFTQETIEEFARVFTGWNYADTPGNWLFNTSADRTLYMVADYDPPLPDSYHDTGSKTLLNGAVLDTDPASLTPAEDDMTFALNNIFNHQNVGPFIGKLLIQRLTTSNPSPEYVERVANVFNNDGNGERGNLGAVIKAILLDEEARNGHTANPDFGKVREPLIRLTHFWRALNAEPGELADTDLYRTYGSASLFVDNILGQAVMRSGSVFNFFLPDNRLSADPAVTLLAPEMQILTEANIAATNNEFYNSVYLFNNQNPCCYQAITRINIDKAVSLADQPDALLEYLDVVLLAGAMPDTMRIRLRDHILSLPADEAGQYTRAVDILFMITASPSFMVQR